MTIIDFSPVHENTSGKHGKIALAAATQAQFMRAVAFCKWYFSATFPNGENITFSTAKSFYHGNSKLYISCCWNSITGKYELTTTTRKIMKTNSYFWKYDFTGNLTDYAKTI